MIVDVSVSSATQRSRGSHESKNATPLACPRARSSRKPGAVPGSRLTRASDLRPDDLAVAELIESPGARQSIDQWQTSA